MKEPQSLAQFTASAEKAANQVIRTYSTSFGFSTRLLGSRHRQHIRNIYALVRVADELVDGMTAEAGLTNKQQTRELDRFIKQTHRALEAGCSSDLVIHAFARTAAEVGIDQSLTVPFFDSMRTDLQDQGGHIDSQDQTGETDRLAYFDATAHANYVYGSAEVIGLMCLKVFLQGSQVSARELEVLERGARQLGAAFQNINFLRDLSDDTERLQRSYLAASDRLTQKECADWVETIRGQLDNAAQSIPLLPRDCRAAVRSALNLFSALTDRLEKSRVEDLYAKRLRVPNHIKLALTIKAISTTWMEPRR